VNRTARQHFVPAFYLSQWAVPEERTGKLRVFDRTNGKSWQTTPDGVAFVRDFYTLDDREAPNAAEDALAKLEAIGADAIRAVGGSNALPDPSAMRPLLAFIALQATRTLRVRENVERFYSDTHMLLLNTLVDAPDAFANHARTIEPDISDEDIARLHEQARALVDDPATRVRMDQTTLVKDTLTMAAGIEDLLCLREWQLCISPLETSFITSDDPVVLDFEPGVERSFLNSPGFGRKDTAVSFVLGPRHLLIGRAPAPDQRVRTFAAEEVARYNTRAAWNAARFFYFRSAGFAFIGPSGEIVAGPSELLRLPEVPART
jgi:hypothetical protein